MIDPPGRDIVGKIDQVTCSTALLQIFGYLNLYFFAQFRRTVDAIEDSLREEHFVGRNGSRFSFPYGLDKGAHFAAPSILTLGKLQFGLGFQFRLIVIQLQSVVEFETGVGAQPHHGSQGVHVHSPAHLKHKADAAFEADHGSAKVIDVEFLGIHIAPRSALGVDRRSAEVI